MEGELATDVAARDAVDVLVITLRLEGTFVQLMHAVALLETLPLGSAVEQIILESLDEDVDAWSMFVRLQVVASLQE